MEVVGGNTLLPGDPRLIDHIVCELKSQGIFDQFRKECIADVDTKPAYQNLRQRVEGSVTGFLKTQNWRPDMNKNQLREMLRKNIYESGFLETGVERIVDQVVNPKINAVFLPQVEEVVYKFLGLAKPTRNTTYNPSNGPLSINTADLLPTDLDPISPDSEVLAKVEKPSENEETAMDNLDDSKNDEFESPPFEPINEQTVYGHDESSNDSRISGISGLTSHDSNISDAAADKHVPDVNNPDSQLSKVSSNSRLSIVTNDSKHTPEKMDISDENTEDCTIKIEENTSLIGDVNEDLRDELEEIRMEINGHMQNKENNANNEKEIKPEVIEEKTETTKINEQVEDITQKAEDISIKEESTPVKEETTTIKEEIVMKEETSTVKEDISPVNKEEIKEETVVDSIKTETKKSDRHRHDSEKRKDKHSDKDRKDDKKSDKDKKDKDKYKSSSSSSRDKDRHRDKSRDSKSTKDKDGKSRDSRSKDDKNKDDKSKDDKSKSSSSSTSKHSSRDRNRSSSSKSDSKSSKDSKSKDSKSSSRKSDSNKSRSRDHSKSDSSKPSSSHTSKDRKSSSSKDYRDKKDPKKSTKQDDHSSSRDKKNDTRRSADRDSNDGSSSLNNTNTTTTTTSKEKDSSASSNKSKSDNSDFSGSNSGDSGQSDNMQANQEQPPTTTTITPNVTLDEIALNPSVQIMKMKKPKIASNIFEVRKLMRIRKKMEKMEKKRQRQQELAAENKMRDSPQSIEDTDSVDSEPLLNTPNNIDELVKNIASITGEDLSDQETTTNSTAIVSKESWDAIEAKLSQSAHENVDFNLYAEDTGDSSSSASKQDDVSTKRAKRLSEEEDCLYFSNEVSPTTERFLQSIERFKKNSIIETKRLKNHFGNVADSKSKGKKRKLDGEIDTENNNKKLNAIGDDVLDTLTASPSGSNLSNGSIDVPTKPKSSRVKKTKKNTTVNCSPSSDIDSEILVETKRPSRASVLKNQRYSSDDLYKPRPVVSGSSRRQRGLLNNTDKKN